MAGGCVGRAGGVRCVYPFTIPSAKEALSVLTDYSVHCPHEGCGWAGSLFPQGPREGVGPACPTQRVIRFHCPRCQREWHARIVGDDAIALPLETPVSGEG